MLFILKNITLLLIVITFVVQAEENNSELTEIDLVLNGLKRQSWSQEELPCYKQTAFVLENAKNYTVWAMTVWNSMQRPVGTFYGSPYSLGNYDQCIQNSPNNVGIDTQYCLAEIKLTNKKVHHKTRRNLMGDTETYLGIRTKMNRDISKITWGSCLPASCNSGAVAKILKVIYMVNPITSAQPSIVIDHCQVAKEKMEYTTGFYVFVTVMITLISLVLFSTIYLLFADTTSAMSPAAKCFCLKRNFLSLTKESSADDLPTLSLTKVVLSAITVPVHSFYYTGSGPTTNIYFDKVLSPPESDYMIKKVFKHIDIFMDVYITMSGLFYMKGLMSKRRNPIVTLLRRYFRLTSTFAIVTLYLVAVSMHTGNGPLWPKFAGREQKTSSATWHWSFLMLNNYIGSENMNMIEAWYIPCDYQLAIMGTIIYVLWQKNQWLGKMVTMLIFVLSILMQAVVTYWNNLPGMLIFDDMEKILDLRKNEVFLNIHIQSQYRAVSYLLGMAMGYIMTVYKPSKYQKLIPMGLSIPIYLAITLSYLQLVAAVVSWCRVDNILSTVAYVAGRKVIFSLLICSLFGILEYGDVPYLKQISQHKIFSVLNRLAYGIYLTHPIILQYIAFSKRHVHDATLFTEVINGIVVWCMSIAVSIPLWFLVETPISNLFNLITDSWTRQRIENGVKSRKVTD